MGRGKVNWGSQAAGLGSDDEWFINDDSQTIMKQREEGERE